MEEFDIKLNKDEVAVLLQLIHVAVQSRGMDVAEAAVVVSKKLKEAMNGATKDDLKQTS